MNESMIATPDRRLRVFVSSMLCIRGDVDNRLRFLESARESFDRVGDDWGASVTLLGIACGLNIAGAPAEIELYEQTLARERNLGYYDAAVP